MISERDILENIEEILEIDPAHLDQELLSQSMRYGKLSILRTRALRSMRIAHERVKTLRSNIIKEEKEGDPSLTVQQLEALYRTNKDYKKAKKKMIKAEYLADMAGNVIQALEQKKWAMGDLVRLYIGEYFAGPNTPNEIIRNYNKRRRKLVSELVNIKSEKEGGRKKRRTK